MLLLTFIDSAEQGILSETAVFLFVFISSFLSVKVMGEESENLESALGINLSLLT